MERIIFEKVVIYATKPLKGKYRFEDKFQIYPSQEQLIQEDCYHFPLNLELSFKQEGDTYFRFSNNGGDQLTRQIIEVLHLLSVATQFYFFNFKKSEEEIHEFTELDYPDVTLSNLDCYQEKAVDDRGVRTIVIPNYMDDVVNAYYALSKENLKNFRKGAYLFYSGVELHGYLMSMSFSSLISALETLMSAEEYSPARCRKCGQPEFKVSARFRQFVYKYAYNGKETSGNKKIINALYSCRSKILHNGSLLLGDIWWDEESKIDWGEKFLHRDLLGITRMCLINWMLERKKAKDDSEESN